MITNCNITIGNRRRSGKLQIENGRIFFDFGYWPELNAEIKVLEGRKYHGYDPVPKKMWSVPITQHNLFRISYMTGKNPYAPYDRPLPEIVSQRPLYSHQKEMVAHGLVRHYSIIAGEMGTGKTLALIEIAERIFDQFDGNISIEDLFWYVAPKAAIIEVGKQFRRDWKAKYIPRFITYEQLVKVVKNWEPGMKAPMVVFADESSAAKNPSSQRSQALKHLCDSVRDEWKDKGYVILISGSPAPKAPTDWWNQCEIARPGFIKEGDIYSFRQRLAVLQERENNITGGKFQQIVAWKDDPNKCDICGESADAPQHNCSADTKELDPSLFHVFKPSVNEIANLYQRMKGLVIVKLKKDCLDLPDKRYELRILPPSASMLRASKLIVDAASSAARGLILLRELSDGFQYVKQEIDDFTICTACGGTGVEQHPKDDNLKCFNCDGTGNLAKMVRAVKEVETPKDKQLIQDLELHEEVGRLVVYAGFTASIDKIVRIAAQEQWNVIRVDARGWYTRNTEGVPFATNPTEALIKFQEKEMDKVVFVAYPGSAGKSLNLTASPSIVYYSNDFNGENRIQSEDRIHRLGMDYNRGATIIDYIHLPSDQKVLDNLKIKRDLQAITLGDFRSMFGGLE